MDSLHEQLNRGSPLAKCYGSGEESSQSEQEEPWPNEDNRLEAMSNNKPVMVMSSSQNNTSSLSCQSEDSRLAEAILAQTLIISDDSLQSESSSISNRSLKDDSIQHAEQELQVPNNLADGAQMSEEHMDSNTVQDSGDHTQTGFIENLPMQSTVVVGESSEMTTDVGEESTVDKQVPLTSGDTMEVDELKDEDEDCRRLPSLEDFYMKDTNTCYCLP